MPATIADLSTALDDIFNDLEQQARDQFFSRDIPLFGSLEDTADAAVAQLQAARQEAQDALAAVAVEPEVDGAFALAAALGSLSFVNMPITGSESISFSISNANLPAEDRRTELGSVRLDADLGLPTFGVDIGAGLALTSDIIFDFDLNFDLETGDLTLRDDSNTLELDLTGAIEADGTASLAFLDLVVANNPDADLNGVALEFDLDFGGDFDATPTSTVSGDVALNLELSTQQISQFLPTFTTDLVVDYAFDPSFEDGVFEIGALEGIAFRDISIEVEALSRLLGGVFDQIGAITGNFPIGPIVRLFRQELPLLNKVDDLVPQLGLDEDGQGGVTIRDLVAIYSQVGNFDPRFIDTLDDILAAIDVLNALDELTSDNGLVIGSVDLSGDALTQLINGDTGQGLADVFNSAGLLSGIGSVDGFADFTAAFNGLADVGLTFPLFEETAPEIIGRILLTDFLLEPVPLIQFELPELALDRDQASFLISVPIGPFAFLLEGGFSASFNISVGYSTNGLRADTPLEGFFDGFYLAPPGDPADQNPIARFNADLSAGFGLNIPGLRVSIDGGFEGALRTGLGDGDDNPNDGLTHLTGIDPNCIFDDISGELTAGVRLTLKVGVSIFSYTLTFSFAEITLANFELGCEGQPHSQTTPEVVNAGLATLDTGLLTLNVGEPLGEDRNLPDGVGDGVIDEIFSVGRMVQDFDENDQPIPQTPGFDENAIMVNAFGVRERFLGVERIEANGGEGNDVLTIEEGLAFDATLSGDAGNDVLISSDGDDELNGGAGEDLIDGGRGDDVINGGSEDDVIRGSEGADRIEGGDGVDQVDYSASTEAIRLTRDGADVLGEGGLADGDTLTNVEYLIGGRMDDLLTGDESNSNTLDGAEGDDTLIGGDGADFIIGGKGGDQINGRGGGDDLVSYVTSLGGVSVNLETGFAFGADADGDLLSRIEGVHGSQHADTFVGDDAANLLDGFAGDDLLEGARGRDTVSGGGGDDTVFARGDGDMLDGGGAVIRERDRDLLSYEKASAPVVAFLAPDLFEGAPANDDTILGALLAPFAPVRSTNFSSFEDLTGSAQNDRLGGDFGANLIDGGMGADTIDASAGDDTVAGNEGADDLEGGVGSDWVDYSASNAGVTVGLGFGEAQGGAGGHAEGDTLTGFENILGSRFGDDLNGDNGGNIFDPGLGQDRVNGQGGDDILRINYFGIETAAGFNMAAEGAAEGFQLLDFFPEPGAANSSIEFINIERFNILGTLRGDLILTGDGADTIFAGGGNDIISSGGGSDIVLAEDGNDLVFSQLQEDPLDIGIGGGEFFFLDGGAGYDGLSVDLSDAPNAVELIMTGEIAERDDQIATFLHGGAITGFEFIGNIGGTRFSDRLEQPGEFANTWLAGGGDDTLAPGLGVDLIDGGETPLDPSLPTDADFLFLDYSVDETGFGVLTLPAEGDAQTFTRTRTVQDTDLGPVPVTLDAAVARNIEYTHVIGTQENDIIAGINDDFYDLRGDTLEGRDGDDLLISFNGDDLLLGGAGGDGLDGGIDDDTLQAGLVGRDDTGDTVIGGAGSDLFIVGDRTGLHYAEQVEGSPTFDFLTIDDFEAGVDQIQLSGSASDYSLTIFGATTLLTTVVDGNLRTAAFINEEGGPSDLDLNADEFTFVRVDTIGGFETLSPAAPLAISSATGDEGGSTLGLRTTTRPEDAFSKTSFDTIDPLGELNLTIGGDDGGVADPDTAFTVEQGLNDAEFGQLIVDSLEAQGLTITLGDADFSRMGDARAFGTFTNGLGLDSGALLSTGKVVDLPGLNEIDGGLISNQFGGLSVDLDFQRLGAVDAPNNQQITFYRADLSDVPFEIASLVLKDDDDGRGGSPGSLSGADIDGLAIIDQLASVNQLANGEASTLDLFDFSAIGTVFTPGSQRVASIPALDADGQPTSEESSANPTASDPDLRGSIGGYVNNGLATLGEFDYNGALDGFLSLGDGGQIGFDLNRTLSPDEPAFLIVAEAGGSEAFSGTFTASSKPLTPEGDLSTDFGAEGAANDTTKIEMEFSVDLAGGEPQFAQLFDLVIASEELVEFSATELQDSISIRLNGANAVSLSNGDAATLERLSASPIGPFHPDLILNPSDDAVDTPEATRADGYTSILSVEGFLQNGRNTIEIEVADQRDGFLDTALLLSSVDSPPIAPTTPARTSFLLLEDSFIEESIAPIDPGLTYELAEGGGVDFGDLTLNEDGSFLYTPDANAFGGDGFIYEVTDARGQVTTGVVDLTVLNINEAPIAANDAFETGEGAAVAGNVFANNGFGRDRELDGQSLRLSAVDGRAGVIGRTITLMSGARLTTTSEGDFTYDPNGVFVGLDEGETATDTFTYQVVDDSGLIDTAEVTITINGVSNTIVNPPFDPFDPPVDPVDPPVDPVDPPVVPDDPAPIDPPAEPDPNQGGDGPDTIDGGASADEINGGGGADLITGGGGGDDINGAGGGDNISGGAGRDTINGGGGRDFLSGDGGRDQVFGGGGRDTIEGGGGADLLVGGGGADSIFGGGGRDTLDGAAGRDVLEGGGGRDLLIGGRGNDNLTGDGGRDVFSFTRGSGRDTITDYNDRQDSFLIERGADSFDDLTITQVGDDALIRFSNVRITVEDQDADLLTASDFIF